MIRLASLAAIMVAVCGLYWPTVTGLATAWLDSDRTTYTHGFLVAAISGWLLWNARVQIAIPGQASSIVRALALAALLACALAWQLTFRASIQIGEQALLPVMMWLSVLLLLGARAARATWPGFAYLYFAVPLWDYLNPIAQGLSVHVVRFLLRLTGVPAYFTDNFVTIPAGTFEIAGGCSGLHFIIVALALAVFAGVVRNDPWRLRLRWLLIALALALVTNWVRIYGVILAGHLTHMQHYLVRESHYGFGWALFTLAMAVFFLIARRVPEGKPSTIEIPAASPVSRVPAAWTLATVLVLALPFALNRMIEQRLSPVTATADAGLDKVAGWQALPASAEHWRPVQHNADRETLTRYVQGSQEIEAYVAEYREQHQGKELGGFANNLAGEGAFVAQVTNPATPAYSAMVVEQSGKRALIWYTYEVGGRAFRSPLPAQVWYSWRSLADLRSVASRVVAFRADCDSTCEGAEARLGSFVRVWGSGT